jgi:transcriptional regulator with XRE-family HTH domain
MNQSFRERVVEEMARQNLSMAEVARRAGVNYNVIVDIRRGRALNPHADKARAIARALG